MKIQIDKSQKIPLYKQIAQQIQAQITSGEIPEGFQFPSERQLAEALGVNRTTVLNAYKELKADGLLASPKELTVSPVTGFYSLRKSISTYMQKKSCNSSGNVLCTGTFSKILCPGYRIGWIAGEKELIRKFVLVKQGVDLQCNTIAQMVPRAAFSFGSS